MFGIFKNKQEGNNLEFLIPVDGTIIDLQQVEDPVFSQKMMGDGFAIIPQSNDFYAPISGEVISLFPHAIGIRNDEGLEVLVHIGIDSVKLDGQGFNLHVKQGDKVHAGDLVISADINYLKDHIPSITTPVIFTNLNNHTFRVNKKEVKAKENDGVVIDG